MVSTLHGCCHEIRELFPRSWALGTLTGALELDWRLIAPVEMSFPGGRIIKGWFAVEKHFNNLETLLGGLPSDTTYRSAPGSAPMYDSGCA